MVKAFFKLLLCTVVYTVANLIANIILPISPEIMEATAAMNPMLIMAFLSIGSAWVCFTMYFIIRNTGFGGKNLFLNLVFVMFFVMSFTRNIDTWFIVDAFPGMTRMDIVTVILTGLISLLATAPLLVHFFQNKDGVAEKPEFNLKSLAVKLGIIGAIYLALDIFFAVFVVMRIEELREYYSTLEVNSEMLVFFRILKGILLGIFVLPLKNMVKTKRIFIVSICLVYLCMAVDLLLPSPLLPTNIRIANLIKTSTSMILFGIIVGNIMWGKKPALNKR